MTEDYDRQRARLTVLRGQRTPEYWRPLQHGEVVAADEGADHFLRGVPAECRFLRTGVRDHAHERLRAVAIGVVLGNGEGVASPSHRGELAALDCLPDRKEFMRSGRRKIAKEHAVQHGEDAGVDADAKRERHHRNGGEQRVLAEGAHAVAEVLPKRGP